MAPTEKQSTNPFYSGWWVKGAEKYVGAISVPAHINQAISYLQHAHYRKICGGSTPLLVSDRVFETVHLRQAAAEGTIRPRRLPSLLWYEHLQQYGGRTENLSAQLISPQAIDHRLSLPHRYVDQSTITAFEVKGDLVTPTGKVEGQVRQAYGLYLNPIKFDPSGNIRKSAKELLLQSQQIHPHEDIKKKRLLWVYCKILNYQEIQKVIMAVLT